MKRMRAIPKLVVVALLGFLAIVVAINPPYRIEIIFVLFLYWAIFAVIMYAASGDDKNQ